MVRKRERVCVPRGFLNPRGFRGGTGDAVAKSRDYWSGLKRHGVVGRSLPLDSEREGGGVRCAFLDKGKHMAVK